MQSLLSSPAKSICREITLIVIQTPPSSVAATHSRLTSSFIRVHSLQPILASSESVHGSCLLVDYLYSCGDVAVVFCFSQLQQNVQQLLLYKFSGLAGYVDNGRLFIIGRYEDMLFAPESAHHASDIEAALLGNTPSFALRSFVLKLPPAHTKSDRGRFLQPTHALHARAVTYDRGTAAQKPRGGVERATCPRAWLTLARKSCQSISGGQEGRRGQWGWWGQTGGGGDDPDKVGYGFGGGLLGGGVAMGRCDAADEKQKNEKGGDSSGAVLVVQRLKASKVAKGAKDRVRQLWECLRGVRQRRWHSRQQEQEIVESLAMIKMVRCLLRNPCMIMFMRSYCVYMYDFQQCQVYVLLATRSLWRLRYMLVPEMQQHVFPFDQNVQ